MGITNGYLKENFHILITTQHRPFTGIFEDPHNIKSSKIEKVLIDIANDKAETEVDPSKYLSKKTGRGRLGKDWINNALESKSPMMCCYKLVEVELKGFMFVQRKLEDAIQSKCRQIINTFMRQLFCWMDEWYGLRIEDIDKLETETKDDLAVNRFL